MTEHKRNNPKAPADVSGRKHHKKGSPSSRKGRNDFARTNRILILLAVVFAVGLGVAIALKVSEDVGAEQNAQTLLEAYKEQESAVVSDIPQVTEEKTPEPTETPEPTPTPTLVPDTVTLPEETAAVTATPNAESIAIGQRVAEEGAANRASGDDENVDETGEYVAPDDPDESDAEALIKEVLNAVGDKGIIGTIRIPKTEQEYPIIGQWSYKLLKLSICRYKGPAVNESGNLVLIGHNYKSGAHFGNLKTLNVGDEVYLTARGNDMAVRYEIYNIVDIENDDFKALETYRGDSGLTLMTCTAGGHQRKVFRCIRKAATADVDSFTGMHGNLLTY